MNRCSFDNLPWETASMKDDDARGCNVMDTPGFMYSHLLLDFTTVQFCHTSHCLCMLSLGSPGKCLTGV